MMREALIISSILSSFSVLTLKDRKYSLAMIAEGAVLVLLSHYLIDLLIPGLLILMAGFVPWLKSYLARESLIRVLSLIVGLLGLIAVYESGDLNIVMTVVLALATLSGAMKKPAEVSYTWLSIFSFFLFTQYIETGTTSLLYPVLIALNLLIIKASRELEKIKKEQMRKLVRAQALTLM